MIRTIFRFLLGCPPPPLFPADVDCVFCVRTYYLCSAGLYQRHTAYIIISNTDLWTIITPQGNVGEEGALGGLYPFYFT